jgi:hypothetical protein
VDRASGSPGYPPTDPRSPLQGVSGSIVLRVVFVAALLLTLLLFHLGQMRMRMPERKGSGAPMTPTSVFRSSSVDQASYSMHTDGAQFRISTRHCMHTVSQGIMPAARS